MGTLLTYARPATTISTNARMALGAYSAAPVHKAAHDFHGCVSDMWGYTYFAMSNGEGRVWTDLGEELLALSKKLAAPAPAPPEESREIVGAAGRLITRFEQAAGITAEAVPVLDGPQGSWPAPGTGGPCSVADIGAAAAKLLGTNWRSQHLSWGVESCIQQDNDTFGYMLGVDECRCCLALSDESRSGARTGVDGATATDGLASLARQVADLVLRLHTSTD
ncbi:hypothetical protein [Streptomyces graminilatus]|uniref:hypothetical protein n=1 Tax=Streptomyces graminilatus TaxID=1464070 RepID=UPI0006E42FAE|nr:hypothetical protein [Streptomyces graminilatus]